MSDKTPKMPPNQEAPKVYDLDTKEGAIRYVEDELLPGIRQAWMLNGYFNPFGVAFANVQGGELTQPTPVGQPTWDVAQVKKVIRKVLYKHNGRGGVVARRIKLKVKDSQTGCEHKTIAVQLEHQDWGDLCWVARIKGVVLHEFTSCTPLDQLNYELKPTRMTAPRYMM